MSEQEQNGNQYEVIIVQCCQNCQSHQSFSRHSEWKYFQQFNQLKRKLQRFINNTIVVKNPIPDELVRPAQARLQGNTYLNKDTNQAVIFPRIGAFQIYIYNILIYSKLLTNAWPNHYKMIQLITKIIQQKKKGNSLHQYSVFQQPLPNQQKPEKQAKPVSKKKKKDYRVYKSKQKSILNESPIKKLNLNQIQPIQSIQPNQSNRKQGRRTLLQKDKQSIQLRSIQTKNQNRIKLPSLRNTISFKDKEQEDEQVNQQMAKSRSKKKLSLKNSQGSHQRYLADEKQDSLKKIFNSIEQFQRSDGSIQRKNSNFNQQNNFNSLILQRNESIDMKSVKEEEEMKMLEDRSVQYSEKGQQKDFMNTSIQYQEQQGFYCDYGLQIDDGTRPKQKNSHYVQTDKFQIPVPQPQKKPYMLDEQVEANIILKKDQKQIQIQTLSKQYAEIDTNTQMKAVATRITQFPQQQVKPVPKEQFNVIDAAYTHLFEKRRNIIDNNYYSIDRFQQKSTKYKWIGRAQQKTNLQQLRKNFLKQCLVFSFYNYFGIKTPQKRLSFQSCSNVIIEQKTTKISTTALVHVLTSDNPEIQPITQFQQYKHEQMIFPISQLLTFKSSKQGIKFTNYGGFLALAYFLGDSQIYHPEKVQLGVVVSNGEIKEIYKMSADAYFTASKLEKNRIHVSSDSQNNDQKGIISLQRTSQQIQMQFISMLTKVVNQQIFNQLLKNFQQTFIHLSPSHKLFRNSLLSMKTNQVDKQTVQQFLQMLKNRRQEICQLYKGQIYSYTKYRSLQPKLSFSLENFSKKNQNDRDKDKDKDGKKQEVYLDRKFLYNQKIVSGSQIQKHIRNKDTFVIISAQSGMGKSWFIDDFSKNLDLKYGDKLRIRRVTKQILNDQILLKKKVDQILDQYRKQVIIIQDVQNYSMQTIILIQKIYSKEDPRTKPEMSFCVSTSSQVTKLKVRINTLGIQIVECSLLGLQVQQIRNFMMKSIPYHNFTDKKNFIQDLIGVENVVFSNSHPKYLSLLLLRNPFYLILYCQYLCQLQNLQTPILPHSKYALLKQIFHMCHKRHIKQCFETQTKARHEQCLYDIRKMAFQYFVNNGTVNQLIKQIIKKYSGDGIIANQLVFYPVQISAIVKPHQQLFLHRQYLLFFLAQAYSYYLQHSFRNMHMSKLLGCPELLSLIKQRYASQQTHSKLLDVVISSRKHKGTWEQASNCMTVLSKIGYIFSNVNFDEVQINQADLTESVFYQCTFRGSNMNNVVLYNAQMLNCLVDNGQMDNLNLYVRKYQSQYTVVTAAMSIDGRYIAMGCGNYLIIVQADNGKQVKKIQAHLDIIRSVKYTRDNNMLITIADDKTLRMWDTRSFRSVVFKLPQKGTIAFSSQTDMIASVNKSSLKVWNIKSMANQFVLQGHSDLITCLQFSADGNNIVTGSRDTTIRIWSTKKGQLVKAFKGHSAEIIALKISPLKKTVASSSKDKDIVVWGFQSIAQICKKKLPDQVTQICLDQKEKFIVIALSKQNYIVVLHLQTLDTVHTLQGHKGKIVSLNFDVSFRKLVSLGRDKTVKIWDFDKIMQYQQSRYLQQKSKKLKTSKGPILSIAYDKLSHKYITSHQNGQINIFSSVDNRHIDQLVSHNGAVSCLQVDKTGKIYSAGSDGCIRVWNLSARREPKVLDLHTSPVIQLRINEKNRIIATSSATQELVIVDFTGINIVLSTRQQGRVQSIQFSKDQKIMAVGGSEKYIAIYQVGQAGNSINRMEQLGPNSDVVTCMVFQGDAYLVAALKNGHIAIWNHLRSTLAKKIQNSSPVTSMLSFQKKYVCFSSQDGKLRVVDMDEGKQVKIFRSHQKCMKIATNASQSLLYESTASGNLIVWNLGSLKQRQTKVEFDRIAYDQQGLKVVQIQGPKELLIRDLHFHEEEIVSVKDIYSDIEGVTYYKGKIILLLKNGIHWELGRKQFSFGSQQNLQGDLYWIRDKNTSIFFKTGVKKLKGIKRPIQLVLQDLSY